MDNLSKHIIPNNSRHQQNKLVLLLWTWNIDYGSKSTRKLPSPAPNSYGRFDRLQRAVDPMQSCRARVNDWNYWQRNLTLMSHHLLLFLFQTWCDPKFLTTCLLGFSDQERETETFRHTQASLSGLRFLGPFSSRQALSSTNVSKVPLKMRGYMIWIEIPVSKLRWCSA